MEKFDRGALSTSWTKMRTKREMAQGNDLGKSRTWEQEILQNCGTNTRRKNSGNGIFS